MQQERLMRVTGSLGATPGKEGCNSADEEAPIRILRSVYLFGIEGNVLIL